MSTRAFVTVAAVALVGAAAGCVRLLADTRAPLSGILVVAWAVAVVVLGVMKPLARALLLAVGVVVIPVAVGWLALDSDNAQGVSESCDPGCISLGGALMLALSAGAVLALAGFVVGAVGRRLWHR